MDPLIDSIVNPGSNADAALGRSPDPLIDSIVNPMSAETGRMGLAFEAGIATPPDRAARVIRAQSRTGLPAEMIEQDLDRVEMEMKKQDFNPDKFRASSPMVAEWMAKNPQNAAIAQDDLDNLSKIESSVKDYGFITNMHQALDKGLANTIYGVTTIPELLINRIQAPSREMNRLLEESEPIMVNGIDVSPKPMALPDPKKMVPDFGIGKRYKDYADSISNADIDSSTTEELSKGNFVGAGRSFAAGLVTNAPQMAAMIAATMAGGPGAGSAFAFLTSSGSKLQQNLDQGIEPGLAGDNALATGAIEVAAENLPLGTLGILKKQAKSMTATHGLAATREVFMEGFKTLAKAYGSEGAEEAITSVAQDLTDWATDVNPDALEGMLQRASDSFLIGGGSGVAMTLPAARHASAVRARELRTSAAAMDFYKALGTSAEASKLRERLPESQRELVEQITKGTGVENVYVPVGALESYFQSKGIPPAAMAQELGIVEAFNEAKESGADIKVPLATWTAKFVATEHYMGLAGDVKFSPEARSANELQAEKKQIQEDLAREEAKAREAEAEVQAQQEEIRLQEDAKQVEEQISAMLEATGRFDKSQIKQYATLFRERYAARAENRGLGETALGLFQRQNLDLVAPQEFTPAPMAAAAQTQGPDIFDEVIASYSKEAPAEASPEERALFNEQKARSKRELLAMAKNALIAIPDVSRDAVADALGLPRNEVRMIRGAPKRNRAIAIGTYSKEEIIRAARGQEEVYAQSAPASTMEDITQTPEFKRWFGKSKAVDGDSVPVVLYRGDRPGKSTFTGRENPSNYIQGNIFFSNQPHIAKGYTKHRTNSYVSAKDLTEEDGLYRAYLSIKKPLVINAKGEDWSEVPLSPKLAQKLGFEGSKQAQIDDIAEAAQKLGYDGIIVRDVFDQFGSGDQYVVFSPEQIKSATGNTGTFDPGSPNIYEQSGQASPRGRILFGNGQNIIQLFEESDASTVLHEAGHLWLEELITDATTEGVNPNLVKDLDSVLEWMKLDVRASDGRAAIKKAIQTDQHELWARGFEAYLMEGKAPSQALRKAFARFKLWLTRIYRNVRGLDVELNDDVRRVFDRLLVGESATDSAEAELAFDPLFADPKAMGMSETQAASYEKARKDAHQAAVDKIQTRIMADLQREQEKWWQQERDFVRREVVAEVESMPEYRALDIIRNGLVADGATVIEAGEVKISREIFRDQYGDEILKTMPKGVFGTNGEGLPPDVVAESVGLRDGGVLVKSLSNLPEKEAYIDQLTEERMKELYPDIVTSEELLDVAKGLAMGEERAKVLRMELEHLASNNLPTLKDAIRRITKKPPTEEAVRRQAEAMINKKVLAEISPRSYQVAATKAAREAGSLLAKGDFDGAFEAKRRQLLNMELHRAAENAIEQKDKALERFKKFRGKDQDLAKTRDTDLVNTGRAILQKYGLGRADKTAEEYLAPMKAYDAEMYSNVSEIVNGAIQNSKPYREMSFDDFMGLADVVDSIWELSKTTREMEIEGKKVDRQEVKAALSERLAETGKADYLPGTKRAITDGERRTKYITNLKNQATRVEHWARTMDMGVFDGAFSKYLVRPILEATTQYRLKKVEALTSLSEIVKEFKIDNPRAVIAAPELDYDFTKPQLIMALLHSGNKSNLKKLLLGGRGPGRAWGSVNADGTLDTSRWDAFIARAFREGIITEADMKATQKIWDLNESLKPAAQKAHKKMYGFYFNEITADTVKTPWGDFKGGYMPAVADQEVSMDANVRAGERLEDSPAQMFPTTGRGFTKARENNYATPLSLEFSKVQNHIDKVLKFSYIEPAVKDATRLVKDRELRAQLNSHTSEVAKDLLEPWLVRAATQKSTTAGNSAVVDKGASWLRRTTSLQFMVFNVTNAIQNTTGLFPAASRVGAMNLAGAMKRYMKSPGTFSAEVQEASPYMRSRMGMSSAELLKEIDEVILQPTKFQNFKDSAIKHGYVLDRATNGMIELVVWGGAYNQALAEDIGHEQAVAKADATVRQTLAAMNPEDLSRFETGTPFVKLFTMFSGFFNTQANLLNSEISIAMEEGLTTKEGALRASKAYVYILALPAIISAIISRTMAGSGLDEDDDGEYFDEFFDVTFGSQLRYLSAMVPVFGQLANAGMNLVNDKPYDDRINASPVISNLEKAGKSLVSVPKAFAGGSVSKAIKEGLAALGLATGLPLTPLAKPLGYWAEVEEGKAKPSGPVDAVRGTITGKRGSEK